VVGQDHAPGMKKKLLQLKELLLLFAFFGLISPAGAGSGRYSNGQRTGGLRLVYNVAYILLEQGEWKMKII
jgi:hypothetical protein